MCSTLVKVNEVSERRYLGLSMVVTRSKSHILGYVRDRMKERLSNWKGNFLSLVGKKVLLKAIIS